MNTFPSQCWKNWLMICKTFQPRAGLNCQWGEYAIARQNQMQVCFLNPPDPVLASQHFPAKRGCSSGFGALPGLAAVRWIPWDRPVKIFHLCFPHLCLHLEQRLTSVTLCGVGEMWFKGYRSEWDSRFQIQVNGKGLKQVNGLGFPFSLLRNVYED